MLFRSDTAAIAVKMVFVGFLTAIKVSLWDGCLLVDIENDQLEANNRLINRIHGFIVI